MRRNELVRPWCAALAALALMVSGCGGGGGASEPPPVEEPPPVSPPPPVENPVNVKLELLTGKATADFADCKYRDGAIAQAQYMHLVRMNVYQDGVYLTDAGENCKQVTYDQERDDWGSLPNTVLPRIRKISNGTASLAAEVYWRGAVFSGPWQPIAPQYPSGFHRRSDGSAFIIGHVGASSDRGFQVDEASWAENRNGRVPGLFLYEQTNGVWTSDAGGRNLVAGSPGQPVVRDGVGRYPLFGEELKNPAAFYAPHDLEADASGLLYLIDDGRIRTIDADYKVTTLDHAALGITGTVRALDADHQGKIHALAQRGTASYTWHRLADGSKVDFGINRIVMTEPPGRVTFTVVGDGLVVSERPMGGWAGRLHRVSANGTVTPLTDENAVSQVQHVEYGVDGHLYVVLPQGVLIARDFK